MTRNKFNCGFINMKLGSRLFFVLGALVIASASAKTYRWVDEDGVTIYSQTPPPSGEATEIKPPPPPAEDPAKAKQRLQQQLQQFDDNREDRELASEDRQKSKKETQRIAKNCAAAKQNYANLEAAARRLIKTSDGEYRRLTEEERQEKLGEARKQIDEFCK